MSKKRNINSNENKEISDIRKDFYKRIFYIQLCLIPIVLFFDYDGAYRLIHLPFILFGVYQLIMIIRRSQLIIDDFFHPKTSQKKKHTTFEKFIYYFSSTLLFIGLWFLIFEINNFDNTINGLQLFWTAGLIGVGIAIIMTIILKLTKPEIYNKSKLRNTVHIGLFGGLFLLSAALLGFINHHFAYPKTYCIKYILEKKSIDGEGDSFFFFIRMRNGKVERFTVWEEKYYDFVAGEEILLCMYKGKLGFYYVNNFIKINE